MKHLLYAVLVSMLALAGCGKSAEEKEAYSQGEAAAAALIDSINSMSELQLEGYLLDVRANEYKYVASGDSASAVSYIEGFEEYIRANSDSITSLIF